MPLLNEVDPTLLLASDKKTVQHIVIPEVDPGPPAVPAHMARFFRSQQTEASRAYCEGLRRSYSAPGSVDVGALASDLHAATKSVPGYNYQSREEGLDR